MALDRMSSPERLSGHAGTLMAPSWRIRGEYLENCNCEVLCPCLLGARNAKGRAMARPTEGHCDVRRPGGAAHFGADHD